MSHESPGFFRRAFHFIGQTLKNLFKGLFGLLLRLVVLLTLLVFILFFLTRPAPIPEGVALQIAPQGTLVEQLSFTPPLSQLVNGPTRETLVRDLTDAIEAAATDPRINSLVLKLGGMRGSGLSKLEQLSVSLRRFKESGKPIIAVGESFDQNQYFLASHADQIYLNPFGMVELTGFGSFRPYFKEALDKLKIKVHVFKVGSFKDAAEPFMRNNMSEASREHNSQWLNALWATYTSRVESQRQLPTGTIENYIDTIDTELIKLQGDTAQLAVEAGLVDDLKTRQQMRESLIEVAGKNGNGSYAKVDANRYIQDVRAQHSVDTLRRSDKVAVVVAKGEILDGEQPAGTIGGDSLAALLRKVRLDDTVDALVLRIDSPGGSAYASEVIRQEILRIKKRGIPVIVSMGSVAASGGYWIAANADQIWATPTTLTGSIGVFGMFPTIDQSLAELGVHVDGISTTELSGFGSLMVPMNEKASRVVQSAVDGIYLKFLKLVAEGRGSDTDAVHQVAQGRVWTGARAQELGLVDQLGNLEDAVKAAAEMADLSDYRVEFIEKPLSLEEQLIRELSNRIVHTGNGLPLPNSLQEILNQVTSPLMNELETLNDPKGYYLRCYDCLVQ